MSEEKALRELKKMKKEKKDAYNKFQAFVAGLRAGRPLNSTEEGFLQIFELLMKGFTNAWTDIIASVELQVVTIKRVNIIETKISELETNLLHLRQTLDKMVQDR